MLTEPQASTRLADCCVVTALESCMLAQLFIPRHCLGDLMQYLRKTLISRALIVYTMQHSQVPQSPVLLCDTPACPELSSFTSMLFRRGMQFAVATNAQIIFYKLAIISSFL